MLDQVPQKTPQAERNLEPIGFAATPTNFDEILAYTRNASTPADATVAAMMAWNLAAKYAEEAIAEVNWELTEWKVRAEVRGLHREIEHYDDLNKGLAEEEHAHLEPCTTCVELVRKIFKEMDPAQQYKLARTQEFTAFARAFEGLI